jgi:hypothetical protein
MCHHTNLGDLHLKGFLLMAVVDMLFHPILNICHLHTTMTIITHLVTCLPWTSTCIRVHHLPMQGMLEYIHPVGRHNNLVELRCLLLPNYIILQRATLILKYYYLDYYLDFCNLFSIV